MNIALIIAGGSGNRMDIDRRGMILSAVDFGGSLSVVSATKDVKPGGHVG